MALTFDRPQQFRYMHLDLRRNAREVRRRHGKPVLSQLLQLAPLVLGGNRISPSDYYRYQLYDDARFSAEERRKFIGDNRYWEIMFRIADWRSCTLTDDKLISSALLASHGFRVPEIRAVFHPHRGYPGARALDSPAALAAFLREEAVFPLFGKPLAGFESRGVVHLQGFDRGSDRLMLHGDESIPVERFVAELEEMTSEQGGEGHLRQGPGQGYIFQELVKQHESIEKRCGKSVCSVRIPMVLQESGPRLLNPLIKIPAPGNVADNFWRRGNLLAAIDRDSGKITRVVRGVGVDLESFDDNPYTHEPLVGTTIPFFEQTRKVVEKGLSLFPGCPFQGWDVAISDDGPVVLEINNGSGFTSTQLSSGQGVYDAEFAEFVEWAQARNPTAGLMLASRWRGHAQWLGPLHGAWLHLAQLFRKTPGT